MHTYVSCTDERFFIDVNMLGCIKFFFFWFVGSAPLLGFDQCREKRKSYDTMINMCVKFHLCIKTTTQKDSVVRMLNC